MDYRLECIEDCGFAAEEGTEEEAVSRVHRHIVAEHRRPVDPSDLHEFCLPVWSDGARSRHRLGSATSD